MSFAEVALVYDRFNDLTAYDAWLAYTLNHTNASTQEVLDVACGTGYFAYLLAQHFPRVKGVDLSPEMIDRAQQRADERQVPVTFQVANMLDLQEDYGRYDLVTCYADSLCFLDNKEAVGLALIEMARCLKVGGTLLFDVWTPYQLSHGFDQFAYHDEDEEGAILWQSFTDSERLRVIHELTVFNRYQGEDSNQTNLPLFSRYRVDLEERTYSLEDYQALLRAAGFSAQQVQVSIQFGEVRYDPFAHYQADRWFFCCRKEG